MEAGDIADAERRIHDSYGLRRKILTNQRTPQADCLVQIQDQVLFRGTVYAEDEGAPVERRESDTTIYGIGSITKVIIACALCILISESEGSEHEIHLGDSINKHINQLSLPESVTIECLLLHVSGLPSLNDLLLGPDGNVWTTYEKVFRAIQNLHESGQINWPRGDKLKIEYSNVGYIVAAFLIKERSEQKSIGRFLQEKLFVPLGMDHTIIAGVASLDAVATPHVFTGDLTAWPIPHKDYSEDTAIFPAMGIYSCTQDLGKFFRALLSAYSNENQEAESPITANVAKMILERRVDSYNDDGEESGVSYSLGACCTSLHTRAIGGSSLNRIISPTRFEQYNPGNGSKYTPREIYYHGGAITGYECAFYLMPEISSFVLVLTNATGLADAADFISRLMLQNLFDLKPEIDTLELSRLCAEDRLGQIKSFQIEDAPAIPPTLAGLSGSYINRSFGQIISIYRKGGSFFATLSPVDVVQSSENPVEFAVVQSDCQSQTISLRALSNEDFARLSIDIYVSWGLDFTYEEKDNKVISLQRKSGSNLTYHRSQREGGK